MGKRRKNGKSISMERTIEYWGRYYRQGTQKTVQYFEQTV